jgi:hypothetical protein
MNLLLLAPDIQEALLFLLPVKSGRDSLTLAEMQSVALEFNWRRQRENWKSLSAALGDVLNN